MLTSVVMGSQAFNVPEYLLGLGVADVVRVLEKTGPEVLWHATADEDTLSLSVEALKSLLAKNAFDRADVEQLISVTETPYRQFPGNSFDIASAAALPARVNLVDLNAGCTGFVDALALALNTGRKTLIICAETYSKHMSSDQRSVKCLFSDGASATFIDPADYTIVYETSSFVSKSSGDISKTFKDRLVMNGPSVFSFGLSEVGPLIEETIDLFPDCKLAFLHQGSKIIIDTLKEKLAAKDVLMPTNLEKRGNVVSATLPILFHDSCEKPLVKNQLFLLAGFGVGLYAHILVLRKT